MIAIFSISYPDAMSVSREKLYEEVWAEPMLKVAARQKVSSSFLARICRRLSVPCPPRGYWAKKNAGLKVKIPPLPPPDPGVELAWARGWEQAPRQPYPPPSTRVPHKAQVTATKRTESGIHSHLSGIGGVFATAQAMSNDYLRPSKRLLADIFATKKCLSRAIEMANQLFLHLEGKGHKVGFSPVGVYFHRPDLNHCEGKSGNTYSWETWHPARPTLVFIGTMPLGLTVFELSEKVEAEHRNGNWIRVSDMPPPKTRRRNYEPAPWTSLHEFPTGRLGLRAYSPYADVPWERQPHAGDQDHQRPTS